MVSRHSVNLLKVFSATRSQITPKTSSSLNVLWVPQSRRTCFCGSLLKLRLKRIEMPWGATGYPTMTNSSASSITPCGYTLWLPPPRGTRGAFHLGKTEVALIQISGARCALGDRLSYLWRTLIYTGRLPPVHRGGKIQKYTIYSWCCCV